MTAETAAKCLVTHWISRFGVTSVITSDQGRQFISRLFATLSLMLGITKIRTMPYHAMANEHLRSMMQKFIPVSASAHSNRACFVHPELNECSHVFMRKDWVKPPLSPLMMNLTKSCRDKMKLLPC
ncbi:hypothetical protein AVEN_266966-1 [Araneus ventricosus]|uniref:Integrase catalytic domain-containing protein n=1 Tax=Araneus ventricosus TaxID=182803 RepID=A0A4Y2HMK0_ARAVE|nr:hypothetical protein AVEN_266966-1 [Araneus ventricosus]